MFKKRILTAEFEMVGVDVIVSVTSLSGMVDKCSRHISVAQKPRVASEYLTGQQRFGIFPLLPP